MSDLPQWHCVCGYTNVGGICTKCGAIPKPATFQVAIVQTFMQAMAKAPKKPQCFEIEVRNPAGMQGLTVLVVDANVFNRCLLPVLDQLGIPPDDLSA